MTDWRLRGPIFDGIWECVIDGKVVGSIKYDRDAMQYRDGHGVAIGRKWDEAKLQVLKSIKTHSK